MLDIPGMETVEAIRLPDRHLPTPAEFLRGELGYDGNESVLSLEMVDISYIRPRSGDTKFEMKVFVSTQRIWMMKERWERKKCEDHCLVGKMTGENEEWDETYVEESQSHCLLVDL